MILRSRTMMKFTALLFSCLMTASVFTACGDSDSTTTSSSSPDKIVEKRTFGR